LFTKISKNKRIIARKTLYLQSIITLLIRNMENKDLNRIKVVLADKKRTNKWLAERLGKDPATVSKWCTNSAQPNLENLLEIAKCLEVDVNELIRKENL
jgi:DNA-binding Xre family transcriptional regulator